MTVNWLHQPGAPTNRFAYKHLLIIDDKHDLPYMKTEGRRVLKERMGIIRVPNSKARYGTVKTNRNTLVVTNRAGMQKMEAWIEQNVRSDGTYTIPVGVGVVVQSHMLGGVYNDQARVGGEIMASIRHSVTKNGPTMEVFHLCGIGAPGDDFDDKDFKMAKGGVSFNVVDDQRPAKPLPARLAHLLNKR